MFQVLVVIRVLADSQAHLVQLRDGLELVDIQEHPVIRVAPVDIQELAVAAVGLV